ncbi:MAG: hypothetical protein H6943_10120 [Zoogloeaceae bacterium]|nr:hypothetical protein [Zoogloeaceae bacterium]
MRYLFLSLPLLYLVDYFFLHGLRWPWTGLLWEVELLSFALVSVPALLQLAYWLTPWREVGERGGKTFCPKYRIRIKQPVPLSVSALPELASYRQYRVTANEIVLRTGGWWSGAEVVFRLLESGGTEIQWSSLNVVLQDDGSRADFMRSLAAVLDAPLLNQEADMPEDFFSFFEGTFQRPFPSGLLPAKKIMPVHGTGSRMVGTTAVSEPCLLRDQFENLVIAGDTHYWFSGVWGYGANSYAFYYVDIQPHRRIWLRLPYAGAYGDAGKKIALVATVLADIAVLLADERYRNADVRIVQNMGEGEIVISEEGLLLLEQPWCFPDTGNALQQLVRNRD